MSNQHQKPILGVSILMLLWIVFPFRLKRNYAVALHQFTQATGLSLQLLPFWWITREDVSSFCTMETPIVSYENRWNDGESLSQLCVRGCSFWESSWDPTALLGFFLFGTQAQSDRCLQWFREYLPHAFGVDDTLSHRYVMETSPENWCTILAHMQSGGKLCFDTWHIRDNSVLQDDYANGLRKLEQLTDPLRGKNIKLIYFQTRSSYELEEYICSPYGYDVFLTKVLRIARDKKIDAPIIIELKPCSYAKLMRICDRIITLITLTVDKKST